jgi:hypothetical protein
MKKILIISFLVLLLGTAGLASVLIDSHLDKQRLENGKTAEQVRTELALAKSDQNSQRQLIRQVQAEMLSFDIAELAAGKNVNNSDAENFYGKGWQKKVASYRTRKETFSTISTASVVLVMISVMVLVSGALHHLFMLIRGKIKSRSAEDEPADQAENNDSLKTEQPQKKPGKLTQKKTQPAMTENKTNVQKLQEAGLSSVDAKQDVNGLGKPMGSFALADKAQASTMMSTEPVTQSLTDLTEQVSAIREFASQQQDRVKQLQDGYDWTIVKRFCIRIIRCIDNLDDSMNNLEKAGEETMHLENVRDELIFALESSGVEQFQPEINSDYKGTEKMAEALSKRQTTEDKSLAGKIASIVRPGYKYAVSDDDIKVVRSAQVMLYNVKECVETVK